MINFQEVYNEHFRDVFLFIKGLSHDEHIAEEITAQAFFKALNALDSFNGECDIRVWLCQIAKNCYFSYLRKNKHMTVLEEANNLPDNKHVSMEDSISDIEESNRIHKLLHGIDEPYREVFTLRIFAELSFKQIGEIFGKTDNWACVTFHRARIKIKSRMEELT